MSETLATAAIFPPGTDSDALPYLQGAADPQAAKSGRIESLRALVRDLPSEAPGGAAVPKASGEINNHIHTIYSFSPYTPSMASWRARAAGLSVVGSVDHDSVGAARELLEASAILGIGSTVGFEVRVSLQNSPFGDRKINNPDSAGIIYMTVQGIPRTALPRAEAFLAPIGRARAARNRRTVEAISKLLVTSGFGALDYDRDVLPLSKAGEGGSVTERHILAAAAVSLVRRFGKGPDLVVGLASTLGIKAPARLAEWLSNPDNSYYLYDLLGLLKAGFLDRVFVQPDKAECPPAAEVIAFAREIGAIPAYAYLGDVADSPTGDKKAEKFEDDYLDELVPWLAELGYQAITYMPPRNSPAQLGRLRALCERCGLMEISGVDINSPRQSFNCPEVLAPSMSRLIDTTWALVAHEKLSGLESRYGLFSPKNPLSAQSLDERIDAYARIGRLLDPRHPEDRDNLARLARDWS